MNRRLPRSTRTYTPLPDTTLFRSGIEYDVSDHGGRFLILTNADGAIDFKIVQAPLDAAGRENWRDLVAHRPRCLILGLQVLKTTSSAWSRSEEHTSELQSLMRISYAVFCLKTKII